MKVLIMAAPRTGSTSLMHNLSITAGFSFKHEPYNHEFKPGNVPHGLDFSFLDTLNDDVIVKSMVGQIPIGEEDSIDFLLKFMKWADYTILLSRRNKQEHLESWVNLWHKINRIPKSQKHTQINGQWWISDIEDILPQFNYNEEGPDGYPSLRFYTDRVEEISKILNHPITYYEDLYSSDFNTRVSTFKSLNLPNTFDSMELARKSNPQRKYRTTLPKGGII